MDVDDQVAAAGGGRLGRLGRLGAGLSRPTGIRNGGLLLVLVGLAVVMALVDRPPEPVDGGRRPGIFQHLPPPVGITRLPPIVAQPPPATTGAGGGERASAARAHPRREHPRPTRSGSAADSVTRPVGGQTGSDGASRPPVAQPPVTTPPVDAAPATRVRVPAVEVRVTPPTVLGRDLPGLRVETPEARVDAHLVPPGTGRSTPGAVALTDQR